MTDRFDVGVIGLGAMGSAALHSLARRGIRAIGIEQFRAGHDRGSSHGESRAIRLAYAEHPSYVPLLREAYAGWRRLEAESGTRLLTITGILEAGHPGSAIVQGSLDASRLYGIPCEVLDAAAVAARFPAFRLPGDWTAVYQADGGFLRPERCIAAFLSEACRHGAVVREETRVSAIEPGTRGIAIRTDGGTIEAGRVIVAAGAWIGEFAPTLAPHLTLTRQVLGWFTPRDPALFAPGAFPVFILDSGADTCYGFPDFAGTGLKAASHHQGRVLARADDLRQDGDAKDEAQIRRAFAAYMPAANGPLTRLRTCLYTRTPDEFFAVDLSPADPRIVLASPCSGHGFKFASVMGDVLADLALEGATRHDIARFRIDRFG